MPTKPLHKVLYRELSIAKAQEVLSYTQPLFEELVNYGSNALIRCATSPKGEENVDLAPLALYRHILEMTDAFEVLISNSCPTPTIPILRSTFEATLSLEYILESNEYYVVRSLCWLASYVNRRITLYNSMLSSTQRGKEFASYIKKDKSVIDIPNPPADGVKSAIKNLENFLSREQFDEINLEFDSFGKSAKWYSLFDGPKSLQELSYHLEKHVQYEFLYRQWSSVTHALDFSKFLGISESGESGIRGIRNPDRILEVSRFAATFMIKATRLLLENFRPGEDFSRYYKREIYNLFQKLTSSSDN